MHLLFYLLASFCSSAYAQSRFNMPFGVTPISHDIYDLHMTIFWICIVIGMIVFGTMFYAMFHYRKARGAVSGNFHEHLWLELTWTIIPLIILIVMAIPATRVLIDIADKEKADITIKVTGFQWKWRYDYLEDNVGFFSNIPYQQLQAKAPLPANYLRTVDHPLVVPIHKKIRFLITSNDVIHSWWVPDLGVKRDAIPGFINESWARINRPGTYYGQCAELCGINHAYMPIVVIAKSQKDYANWLAEQKGAAPVSSTPLTVPVPTTAPATQAVSSIGKTFTHEEMMKKGEQIYLMTCAACHKPDGTGMPPTFPALKGSAIAAGSLPKHENIVMLGKPGTAMQAFKNQLSDEDIAAVITYERNSWGNNKGDTIQPDDIKKLRLQGPPP